MCVPTAQTDVPFACYYTLPATARQQTSTLQVCRGVLLRTLLLEQHTTYARLPLLVPATSFY
jgi:hypothetical protein